MAMAKSAVLLAAVCACGDPAPAADAMTTDVDNGMCGGQLRFTGELVDWDSGAAFCGIFGASIQVQGASDKESTAPNGRFDMCIPDQPTVLLDVAPPAEASPCARPNEPTSPDDRYALPAIAVASKAVLAAGGMWSGRAFVTPRQVVTPGRAQVFVHVNGAPRTVAIEAQHAGAQVLSGGSWTAGSTGTDVFFLDVAPGNGSTILTAGGAVGTSSIPLVAGRITMISIGPN